MLNTPAVIPLFYDYTCAASLRQCKGQFRSTNKEQSPLANPIIATNLNTNINAFAINDYVGFALSKQGQLIKSNLNTKANPVKGVVCSTNYNPDDVIPYLEIGCEEILQDNIKFTLLNSVKGTQLLLECAPGCKEKYTP